MLLAVLAVVVVGRAACIDVVAVLAVVVVGRAACIDVAASASRGCGRASGLY